MNLQDCVGNELHREGQWGIQPFLKIDNIRIILPVSEDEMSHSQITTCENISEGAAYSPCVSLCHATQIALIAYVDSTAGYRLSIDYKHGLAVHCISATRANMDDTQNWQRCGSPVVNKISILYNIYKQKQVGSCDWRQRFATKRTLIFLCHTPTQTRHME